MSKSKEKSFDSVHSRLNSSSKRFNKEEAAVDNTWTHKAHFLNKTKTKKSYVTPCDTSTPSSPLDDSCSSNYSSSNSSSHSSSTPGMCFKCGRTVHVSKNCGWSHSKTCYVPFLGRCYNCGQTGHTQKNCSATNGQMTNSNSFVERYFEFIEDNWDDYLSQKDTSFPQENDWHVEADLERERLREKEAIRAREQELAKESEEKEKEKVPSDREQFEDCPNDTNVAIIKTTRQNPPIMQTQATTSKDAIQYYVSKKREWARTFFKIKKKNFDELNGEVLAFQAKSEQFDDFESA